ncbi:MAG: hypothetical protein ACTHJL_12470 [Amnibacterium sp.]
MLQGRLWGRPTLGWAIDAGVVVLAIGLLIFGDSTLRLLAVLLLVWRAVSVGLALAITRRAGERRR